jgi:hypothetical protein
MFSRRGTYPAVYTPRKPAPTIHTVTFTDRSGTKEVHDVHTSKRSTAEAWARNYAKPWQAWEVAPK